jgi:hypothetical protein
MDQVDLLDNLGIITSVGVQPENLKNSAEVSKSQEYRVV